MTRRCVLVLIGLWRSRAFRARQCSARVPPERVRHKQLKTRWMVGQEKTMTGPLTWCSKVIAQRRRECVGSLASVLSPVTRPNSSTHCRSKSDMTELSSHILFDQKHSRFTPSSVSGERPSRASIGDLTKLIEIESQAGDQRSFLGYWLWQITLKKSDSHRFCLMKS